MQTPLFGPPKLGPRPRAGRNLTDLPSLAGFSIDRQGDKQLNPASRTTTNASDISVYDNEGYIGALSETRNRRARENM